MHASLCGSGRCNGSTVVASLCGSVGHGRCCFAFPVCVAGGPSSSACWLWRTGVSTLHANAHPRYPLPVTAWLTVCRLPRRLLPRLNLGQCHRPHSRRLQSERLHQPLSLCCGSSRLQHLCQCRAVLQQWQRPSWRQLPRLHLCLSCSLSLTAKR